MKPICKVFVIRSGLLVLLAAVTACSQQAVKSVDHCRIDSNNNVDRMFSQVSDKLADNSCHYFYPEYREQLVAAAKGAPGPENEARFASLLRESIERGIIQNARARYFSASTLTRSFSRSRRSPAAAVHHCGARRRCTPPCARNCPTSGKVCWKCWRMRIASGRHNSTTTTCN